MSKKPAWPALVLKILVFTFFVGVVKIFFSSSHLEVLVVSELMFSSLAGVIIYFPLDGQSFLALLLYCVLVVMDGVVGVSVMLVNYKNRKDSILVAFTPGVEYK